eukprot:Skav230123  [mRNA]  locus=scaffold2192:43159:46678:+ [translate_table: standard]
MAGPNLMSSSDQAFRNVENPRLREPPERLRRRLVAKGEQDLSTSEGMVLPGGTRNTKEGRECEVLPGAHRFHE